MSQPTPDQADAPLRSGLSRLLRPRSIAIAGASPDPASMGGAVLANCDRFGFAGPIHLISPTRDSIGERPCIKSADDLPEGVDAVVLNVPRAAILPSVEACARRKVGGVVVFAAGFAEAGEEGRREQEQVAAICRDAGMALLGPNCLGFINYVDGVALTFEAAQPRVLTASRRVAVIAQSGATAAGIRAAMLGRGIEVAFSLATGNEAVTGASDLIDTLLDGAELSAVALYSEQISDPRAFLAVARKARAAGVPIVMLHPGRSLRGREAAASHTGSMVGDYALMKSAVENEGVVAVDTMDEMLDAVALLHRYPAPPSGRLGIVTNSGAIRGMGCDFAEDIGLELAEFSSETTAALQALIPAGMEVDNPLDVGTSGFMSGEIYATTTSAMLANPAVGAVLLSLTSGAPPQQRSKSDAVVPVALAEAKPVAMAITGDEGPLDPEFMRAMRDSATPLFRSTERAMRAFAICERYAEALAAIDQRTPAATGLTSFAEAGVKPEYVGKRFLRELGLRVPAGDLAVTLDDAKSIAARIGYPVVLKAQAVQLSHKSDAGGVALNLKDEAALAAAWDAMSARLAGEQLDGILVEQMSTPGLEMILGARDHPEWGPSVLVGLGGVLTEALDATVLLPADITRDRAEARIRTLRGSKLFGDFRGRPPRDIAAVADAVVRLGAAMRAGLGILEIDINPLMVLAEGEGAIALDALLVTGAGTSGDVL